MGMLGDATQVFVAPGRAELEQRMSHRETSELGNLLHRACNALEG